MNKRNKIDEIILAMRDINSLTTSKIERAWTVNNSMAHEPQSTHKVMKQVVHILDSKYEKTDLQSVVSSNCTYLSLQDQNKLLELLTEYEELFDGPLDNWNTKPVFFELKEGAKLYHERLFSVPKSRKEQLSKN